MAKLRSRHARRMHDAVQATSFAEAAVSNARMASLLSAKQRMFHQRKFRHSRSNLHIKNSSFIPLSAIGRSLAHGAGLPTFVGEGAAKVIALAGHALSFMHNHSVSPRAEIVHQSASSTSGMHPLEMSTIFATKHGTEGIVISPKVLAAVKDEQTVKTIHAHKQASLTIGNSSQVLLLVKAKCQEDSRSHPIPKALAASWALETAARQLHSDAMNRVACEVRQRKAADARQLLVVLARSLQAEDPAEDSSATDVGDTSECEQKKLAIHSELREAENNAMNASADAGAAATKLEGLQHEVDHLSPYLPKLKADQAGLKSGKNLFKMLHEEDAAEAEEIEDLTKDMMDDLQGEGFTGYEKALTNLVEMVKTLPAWAESDMKDANKGIDEINEKLAIRVSLVSGWVDDLQAKIKETKEELNEASARKQKTAEVLAEVQEKSNFTCAESPEAPEADFLLLHTKSRKLWVRKMELSAINLASSLLQ